MRREIFLEEFWKCFQRLEDTADEMVGKAAYFRFLTLLGMTHTPANLLQVPGFALRIRSGRPIWQLDCMPNMTAVRDSHPQVCRYS